MSLLVLYRKCVVLGFTVVVKPETSLNDKLDPVMHNADLCSLVC